MVIPEKSGKVTAFSKLIGTLTKKLLPNSKTPLLRVKAPSLPIPQNVSIGTIMSNINIGAGINFNLGFLI